MYGIDEIRALLSSKGFAPEAITGWWMRGADSARVVRVVVEAGDERVAVHALRHTSHVCTWSVVVPFVAPIAVLVAAIDAAV